jgi:hypothetical protein
MIKEEFGLLFYQQLAIETVGGYVAIKLLRINIKNNKIIFWKDETYANKNKCGLKKDWNKIAPSEHPVYSMIKEEFGLLFYQQVAMERVERYPAIKLLRINIKNNKIIVDKNEHDWIKYGLKKIRIS